MLPLFSVRLVGEPVRNIQCSGTGEAYLDLHRSFDHFQMNVEILLELLTLYYLNQVNQWYHLSCSTLLKYWVESPMLDSRMTVLPRG